MFDNQVKCRGKHDLRPQPEQSDGTAMPAIGGEPIEKMAGLAQATRAHCGEDRAGELDPRDLARHDRVVALEK